MKPKPKKKRRAVHVRRRTKTTHPPKQFSAKYRRLILERSPRWIWRRRIALVFWLGRDALLPLLPAHHVDHLHYRNLGKFMGELPLLDVIPLHRKTHRLVTELRQKVNRALINLLCRALAAFWLVVIWAIPAHLLIKLIA